MSVGSYLKSKTTKPGAHAVITISMLIVGAAVVFGGSESVYLQVLHWVQTQTGNKNPEPAVGNAATDRKWLLAWVGAWIGFEVMAELGAGDLAAALAVASAMTATFAEVEHGGLIANLGKLGSNSKT